MKILRFIVLAVFLVCPAFARDFRPASHLENIPLPDSSIQQCYVFQTTPGVQYTVESSNDLSTWTTQDELYGLGNEYVVTMREYLPPPPPPPGTPSIIRPAPATNVSLRLQPASGPLGGAVASWRSMDHGGPIIVRIAGEMNPGWNQVLLFSERYDDYCFFLWHPGLPIAPPAENSPLGPNDSAMLAVLEANLPALNQQIADAVIRSRNAPPPAPPNPDSKRFWRVRVDADLDTDHDGSPDWAEYEIATRGTGMLVSGVVGDAFDADSNSDGIPDGDQLDADLDATADAKDPDAADNTATIPIGPLPRYALFPITNAQPPSEWSAPYQINDRGRVLYHNGTWCGGVWTPLQPPTGTDPLRSAFSLNDHDVILGDGRISLGTDPETYQTGICYWSSPDAVPSFVSTSAGKAVTSLHMAYRLLHPGPVLSNDGHFFAPTHAWVDDRYKWIHNGYWKLPSGNEGITEEAADSGFYWNQGSVRWGAEVTVSPDGEESWNTPQKGMIKAPGALPALPFVPGNIISKEGNPVIALPLGHGVEFGMALVAGVWRSDTPFANAVDISDDGFAIGKNHGGLTAPMCMNGRWTDIKRTAPDVSASWRDSTVKLLDTTSHGWILTKRGVEGAEEHAAMLPITLEGIPNDPMYAEGATGVDGFSITCDSPDPAVQDRIWIMAPLTEGQTKFVLKAPLTPATPLTLKLESQDIRFDGAIEKTLIAAENEILLECVSGNETTRDAALDLSFGANESVSKPLGVKIMKDRIVRVKPFLVIKRTMVPDPANPGQYLVEDNPPDLYPSRSSLENYLNDVFKPQLNTTFVVSEPSELLLDWDGNKNGSADFTSLTVAGPELQPMMDLADGYVGNAVIKVFFLGTDKKIFNDSARGFTISDDNTCWIVADTLANPAKPGTGFTLFDICQTTAHEIGHILIDSGHPDDGQGPSVLPGTNHLERLMVSGRRLPEIKFGDVSRTILRKHRLVKGEWDKAEEWLNSNATQ